MKTFSQFRNNVVVNEDISFMDMTPTQGTSDSQGRPCVYLEKGSCFTPVSEDFSGFPELNMNLDAPVKQDNPMDTWHKEDNDKGDIDALGARMHKSQNTGAADETNPDHNAIASYTDESEGLNKHLFKSHLAGTPVTKKLNLDTALEKHKAPEDFHAYSGTGFNPGAIASKHPDNILHLPAFTSTSLHKETATNFSRSTGEVAGVSHHHIIDFHMKAGQKGMYVGRDHNHEDHEQLSQTPHEREFLMPRNSTVNIHPVPKIIHDHENNRQYHIWSAHVMENNE
jgi:hypothetical protein